MLKTKLTDTHNSNSANLPRQAGGLKIMLASFKVQKHTHTIVYTPSMLEGTRSIASMVQLSSYLYKTTKLL